MYPSGIHSSCGTDISWYIPVISHTSHLPQEQHKSQLPCSPCPAEQKRKKNKNTAICTVDTVRSTVCMHRKAIGMYILTIYIFSKYVFSKYIYILLLYLSECYIYIYIHICRCLLYFVPFLLIACHIFNSFCTFSDIVLHFQYICPTTQLRNTNLLLGSVAEKSAISY